MPFRSLLSRWARAGVRMMVHDISEKQRFAKNSCARCRKRVEEPSIRIRLWDGREYCKSCVNAVDPILMLALNEQHFVECLVVDDDELRRGANRWWRWHLRWISVAVIIPLFHSGVAMNRPALAIGVSFFILLFTGGLAKMKYAGAKRRTDWNVSVSRGKMWVYQRATDESRFCAPLADWAWYEGELFEGFFDLRVGGRPTIILVVPGTVPVVCISCGLTGDAFRMWHAFLTISEVPKVKPMTLIRRAMTTIRRMVSVESKNCAP